MVINDSQERAKRESSKAQSLTSIIMAGNLYPNVIGLLINALNLEDMIMIESGMR